MLRQEKIISDTGVHQDESLLSTRNLGAAQVPALERTLRESVAFNRPFFVEGADRQQPAGTYVIETIEALIEGLSFLAYRRVSTSIVLPLPGSGAASYQLVRIDPTVVQGGTRAATAFASLAPGKGNA